MSEHTMGKFTFRKTYLESGKVCPVIFDHDGRSVAAVVGATHPKIYPNARRLVACWNLCDGVPTEQVEAAPDLGRLLAALKAYIAWEDAELSKERNHGECVGLLTAAEKLARAVIAKVEART